MAIVDDAALRRAYALGQQTWPRVALGFDAFKQHLSHVLGEAPDWDWSRYAPDLYLCCACALGDRDATVVLETQALPKVLKSISRVESDRQFVEDALQSLRDKLLVGPHAKIAAYSGRGSLIAWLNVAAAHVALDAVRERTAHRLRQVDLPERLAQTDVNPLNEIIKSRYAGDFQNALRVAVRELSSRDRNLLRLRLVGHCSIDQLGRMYQVNRATAARWLEGVRKRVFESVRRQLQLAHGLTDHEFDSIARGVQSQLDISLSATLSEPMTTPAEPSSTLSASSETEPPPRDPG
jgi:RNA polymerase sigma-70 factor, ECF subfamily